MKQSSLWVMALLLLAGRLAFPADYPPPLRLGPTNTYGRDLQRSLRLMASSDPEKKRTIKVLFYGQSITQEIWSVWLADALRQRYPNANLVITNLALGFDSATLRKPATIDIPNFYPDLMIFQDYGPESYFEDMVALARRETTADILIQTDHINRPEDLHEPVDPSTPGGLPYWSWRNYVALPGIALKYGAELADIRTYWKQYLEDYNLGPEELLRDHIHPNRHGSFLMSELIKSYLREDLSFASDDWSEAEKYYEIGKDVHWSEDLLLLPFVGNRVDVILKGSENFPVQVHIDNRPPSQFPELYRFTRADWYPNTYWLSILRIGSRKPLLDEEWKARIVSFSTNGGAPSARFEVIGSKTGWDGEGSIKERFVSNSGRVVIEPEDWLTLYWAAAYYPAVRPLVPGDEIRWTSHFAGKDSFVPEVSDPGLETTVTVARGLANGAHVLQLNRIGLAPIAGIRVFNPLARKQPRAQRIPEISTIRKDDQKLVIQTRDAGRYVLETSEDCVGWTALSAPLDSMEFEATLDSTRRFFRVRCVN